MGSRTEPVDRWVTIARRADYVDAWQLFDSMTLTLRLQYGEGLRLVEDLGGGLGQLRNEYWPPMPNSRAAGGEADG